MINHSVQYVEETLKGNGQEMAPKSTLEEIDYSENLPKSDRLDRLEIIVEQMAHAVLATADVVDRLGERMDFLSLQVQQQGQQFQQQGYQVYTITDAVQTLIENQADSAKQLNDLMITITHLAKALEHQRR